MTQESNAQENYTRFNNITNTTVSAIIVDLVNCEHWTQLTSRVWMNAQLTSLIIMKFIVKKVVPKMIKD